MSYEPQPVASGGAPKRLLLGLGAIVLVAGFAVGGVFFAKSGSAVQDTVAKFARAPIGCTTTLEFDKSGTFTLFVETKGTSGALDGDCSGAGKGFSHTGTPPAVTMSLSDSTGAKVTMTPFTGYSYDTDRYVGRAVNQVSIRTPGTFRLTVAAEANDLAVAVGGDPEVDASTMKVIAIGSAIAGLVVGGLLMFLGRPRSRGAAPQYVPATPIAPAQGGWQAPGAPVPPPPAPSPGGWQTPPPPPPPVAPGGWDAPHQ